MGAFRNELSKDEAYINGIGRFDIELSGNSEVVWSQNGKQLKPNSQILKFEMSQEGNRRSLIVKNVTKADYCKYSVSVGSEKKESTLAPKMPFVQTLRNSEGYIGGIAVFECQVHPGIQVQWYYGTKPITRQNFSMLKYEQIYEGTKRKLIVKNIANNDFTQFSCEAKSEKSTAELCKMTPWIERLQEAKGFMSNIAVFQCKVRPATQVTWYAGNTKICKQNFSLLKYETLWEGDYRKLLVKNITQKDLIEFSCEAKGEKCNAKLSKMSPWVENIESTEGVEGGIAVFEVMVQPHTHVTWYAGNKKITKQNFSLLKYEDSWSGDWRKLIVKNITQQDFTEFTCEANGEKCSSKLTKGSRAKELRSQKEDSAFASKPRSASGSPGKIEVFECQMKNASQDVYWYKGDKHLDAKSFSILKYEVVIEGNRRKLIVKNILPSDAGNYVCKAIGANSQVACMLTVGDNTDSQNGFISNTIAYSGVRADPKERAFKLAELRKKDMESRKKWLRCPDCWNAWMINPAVNQGSVCC